MTFKTVAERDAVTRYSLDIYLSDITHLNRVVQGQGQPPVALHQVANFLTTAEELFWRRVMGTRIMYDSTDPTIIPATAEIVAYYPHAWGTDISKHEHALVVRIDNRGDHADDCHILDVEAGAANNTTAHEWVMSWHKLHPQGLDAVNGWIRKPVLYCSESALPALRTACAGLDYDIWVANWSTGTTPVAGCFAKQFTDHGPHGENYDMSAVYDDTWGHKPTTPTPPPPPPQPHPAASQAALLVWGVGPDVCSWREVHSTDGGKTWS
jgi:hypothetical protein